MSVIKKISQAVPLPNTWIENWKNEGKMVLGYFCSYIPEEIMHAAGILPVRIRAYGCSDTPMGDAYMSDTTCSYTRCCLEMAYNKKFNYLDGIISCNSCDQIRRCYDNIRYKAPFPFQYFISLPSNINKITIDWYEHELVKFKEKLEKNFGVEITDKKLSQSIKMYNESRKLLGEIYKSRNNVAPVLSGTDIMNIIIAGTSIPRNKYNELLTQLLEEVDGKEGNSEYRARIMLVGSELDDPEYVKIIEDLGALVSSDFLCFGTKYFWDLVDETLDPLEALAKRYLCKISCPRMPNKHISRIEFIKKLIKESYSDGVILQRIKFCPMHWGEIYLLNKELKELGVPCLNLEREYVTSSIGAFKTRVQAFIEVLEGEEE